MIKLNPAVCIRPRKQGDALRLPGGSRTLKRLMIDRKIPVSRRSLLPVVETQAGIAAVFGLEADVIQKALPGDTALIIQINRGEMWK